MAVVGSKRPIRAEYCVQARYFEPSGRNDDSARVLGPRPVRDPMDRLVVAAARATRSRLMSADETLDGHGVERVWD